MNLLRMVAERRRKSKAAAIEEAQALAQELAVKQELADLEVQVADLMAQYEANVDLED